MKQYITAALLVLALPTFAHSAQASKVPIKPLQTLVGPSQSIGDIDFRAVRLGEVARLISQLSGYNVIASSKVSNIEVSLYLRNTTLPALVSNLCRATGLWYRFDRDSRTYILMSEDEFRHDIAVARDDKTRILTLKHNNVVSAANAVKSLFGGRVQLEEPIEESPPVALQPKNRGQLPDGNTSNNAGSTAAKTLRNPDGTSSSNNKRNSNNQSTEFNSASPDSMRNIQQLVADASANVLKGLQEQQGKINPTGAPIYLTYNKLHNLLMVRSADEDALQAIEQLIASIDLPAKQVLLELQILELSVGDDFKSEFGFNFTGSSRSSISGGKAPDRPQTGVDSGDNNAAPDIRDIANLPVSASGLLWNFISDRWRIRLNLLQSENKVRVLSTPSLVSINNQPARLFIGEETILTTGVKSDTITNDTQNRTTVNVETERRDIGQTLTLLPRINADGSIALTIDQETSNIIKGGASLPISLNNRVVDWPVDTVSTSTSQLTVLANNGLPIIIGGLTRTNTRRYADKVPFAAEIPVLGHLFRSTSNEDGQKQLVLIVTPYLVDAQNATPAAIAKREALLNTRIDTAPRSNKGNRHSLTRSSAPIL